MTKSKLTQIKEILLDFYGDRMNTSQLESFAEALYESVFVDENDLDDIAAIVNEYEADAEISSTEFYYVFVEIVELMEDCASTAKRLYKSFMYDFDSFETFLKLVTYNEEYISAEELHKAKQKALRTFDKELLALYDIEE